MNTQIFCLKNLQGIIWVHFFENWVKTGWGECFKMVQIFVYIYISKTCIYFYILDIILLHSQSISPRNKIHTTTRWVEPPWSLDLRASPFMGRQRRTPPPQPKNNNQEVGNIHLHPSQEIFLFNHSFSEKLPKNTKCWRQSNTEFLVRNPQFLYLSDT